MPDGKRERHESLSLFFAVWRMLLSASLSIRSRAVNPLPPIREHSTFGVQPTVFTQPAHLQSLPVATIRTLTAVESGCNLPAPDPPLPNANRLPPGHLAPTVPAPPRQADRHLPVMRSSSHAPVATPSSATERSPVAEKRPRNYPWAFTTKRARRVNSSALARNRPFGVCPLRR